MSSATRRAFVSTAALGTVAVAAGVASPAQAGRHHNHMPPAAEIRRIHRERLRRASQDFATNPPSSREGIEVALQSLTEMGVIEDDNDYSSLRQAVLQLFDDGIEDVQTLLERVREAIAAIRGDTAETIGAVLQDSVEYAVERSDNPDEAPASYSAITNAIAHDVQGAIQGAAAGARIGALFGLPVVGAIIGALGGGASGSVIGYFEG